MKLVEFTLEGLRCEGCVDTVSALLRAESGVHGVEVSLGRRSAKVLFDPSKTDATRLAAAIEKPGYRVIGRSI